MYFFFIVPIVISLLSLKLSYLSCCRGRTQQLWIILTEKVNM